MTGANGFIGRWTLLALNRLGLDVVAVSRTASSLAGVVNRQIASLNDCDALTDAMHGVRTVVHLAGRAHVARDNVPGAFEEVNLEGSRSVLDAAISSGVQRFIFVSSIAAVCTTSRDPVTEDAEPQPDTPYGRSKLDAERLLCARGKSAGIQVIALRPSMVYGPGMKGNPLRLFEMVARGTPLPIGRIRNSRSVLYVGNLADAIGTLVQAPRTEHSVFHLSDPDIVSTLQLTRQIAASLKCRTRILPVPVGALSAMALIGDLLGKITAVPFDSDVLARLNGSLIVDSELFRDTFDFCSPVSFRDGIQATADWFQTVRASATTRR